MAKGTISTGRIAENRKARHEYQIEEKIEAAKKALEGEDLAAIDAAVEELNKTIQPVAQKMYEAAAAEEQQQPEAQPASNQGDDVIDADFEVKE